jgi:hypothetical protein
MIAGIEITPDGKTAYAFAVPHSTNETVNGYIVKSTDGGKTWVRTDGQIMATQFISKFAFGNNGIVYAALIQIVKKQVWLLVYTAAMTMEKPGYWKARIIRNLWRSKTKE